MEYAMSDKNASALLSVGTSVPRRYRADIRRVGRRFRTRSGKWLTSRLLTPADAPLLVDFFYRLSDETLMRRFHQPKRDVGPDEVRERAGFLADVDNQTHGGAVLALEQGSWGERVVGVARLMRAEGVSDAPEAEAAIVIRDDFHGDGVGTELLRRLVLLARSMKVRTMVANIEATNYPALRLFRKLELPTTASTSRGETTMLVQIPY